MKKIILLFLILCLRQSVLAGPILDQYQPSSYTLKSQRGSPELHVKSATISHFGGTLYSGPSLIVQFEVENLDAEKKFKIGIDHQNFVCQPVYISASEVFPDNCSIFYAGKSGDKDLFEVRMASLYLNLWGGNHGEFWAAVEMNGKSYYSNFELHVDPALPNQTSTKLLSPSWKGEPLGPEVMMIAKDGYILGHRWVLTVMVRDVAFDKYFGMPWALPEQQPDLVLSVAYMGEAPVPGFKMFRIVSDTTIDSVKLIMPAKQFRGVPTYGSPEPGSWSGPTYLLSGIQIGTTLE